MSNSALKPAAPAPSDHRGELRSLAKLAFPIITVQLGMMAMGLVDSAMVGRVSKEALAGAASGHAFGSAVIFIFAGILMALDPLVAQAYGAGESRSLSRILQRGAVLTGVLGALATALLWPGEWALRFLNQPEAVLEEGGRYVRIVGTSSLAFLGFVGLRQFMQALGRTRPLVIAIVVGNLVNVLANWGLIFGKWGLPALGLEGSAISTAISRWVMFGVILLASRRQIASFWMGWEKAAHVRPEYVRLLRLGLPLSLHVSVELWVFSAVTFLMGLWGVAVQAGHNVALVWASVTFMVPLGVGMAAAVRVGQAVGRRDAAGARRSAVVALAFGSCFQVAGALVFLLFPELVAGTLTDDVEAIKIAVALLPIAGIFQLCDGLQTIAGGILRGAGDTKTPALLALFGYWGMGLPIGGVLVYYSGQTYRGWWWGLCIGLTVVSALLLLRIREKFRGALARA